MLRIGAVASSSEELVTVVKVDHETRRYSCSTTHRTQIRIWKPPTRALCLRWPARMLTWPAGFRYRLVSAHFYHWLVSSF